MNGPGSQLPVTPSLTLHKDTTIVVKSELSSFRYFSQRADKLLYKSSSKRFSLPKYRRLKLQAILVPMITG